MAPTVDVDTMIPSSSTSSPSSSNNSSRSCSPEEAYQYHHGFGRRPSKDPLGVPVCIQDFDNSCETYFCSRDVTPSLRSVIPEASPAFREAMGKMKLERKKDVSYGQTHKTTNSSSSASSRSSISSSSSSSLTLPDRYKSSSSSSSSLSSSSSSSSFLSPRDSESNSNKFISSAKFGSNSKRPASFGGSDSVRPRTDRRASHCEKRVSWADERGSAHQLISVRLIRPRLSLDTNVGIHGSTPGQSILRNTGTH